MRYVGLKRGITLVHVDLERTTWPTQLFVKEAAEALLLLFQVQERLGAGHFRATVGSNREDLVAVRHLTAAELSHLEHLLDEDSIHLHERVAAVNGHSLDNGYALYDCGYDCRAIYARGLHLHGVRIRYFAHDRQTIALSEGARESERRVRLR